MLARRVIAISPDKAIAKRLSAGLMAAGGTAETYPSLDSLAAGEISASLVVFHFAEELNKDDLAACAERMRKDAYIIVVVGKSELANVIAAMQASDRVAGVLVEDSLTISNLAAMATRVLHGDIFGLEKIVPWGTKVYSMLVGDYQEKSICIAQISEFAGSMGVRRKYRESIEQCSDEMLMNALYDAPVDSSGNQLFADVPTKTRISLRMEQKAVVQYSCNSDFFTLSVRDSFGTLTRDTVIKYIYKCLYSDQQIDRKAGGAGLGLYIMANATSAFFFNVLPGVATECICTFDLRAPKVQLKDFGFFTEKIDASGRLVAGTSKLLTPGGPGFPVERRHDERPPASRAVVFGLSGAILLLLALIAMVAYPRFMSPPTAAIEVRTQPPDAVIEVNGQVRGTATDGRLVVEDLEVGRAYRVTARAEGWNAKDTVIEPAEGRTAAVELRLDPKAASVLLDSDPQGAKVVYEGRELGVTPVSVDDLPPGQQVTLTFRKTGYRDIERSMRVPRPGGEGSVSVSLPMDATFGSVSITSEPPGAQVLQNGELLAGVTTPVAEHIVQAGREYTFTLKAPGFMPAHVTASVKPGERGLPVSVTLKPGGGITVRSNVEGRATVLGVRGCAKMDLPMLSCPVPNGTYKVRVEATRPPGQADLSVTVNGNESAHDLEFGFVEAGDGFQLELRRGKTASKAAFEAGSHKVTIVTADGAERKEVTVKVQPGRSVTVP